MKPLCAQYPNYLREPCISVGWFESILSAMFPPKFPKLAPGDIVSEAEYAEQGTCGPVRRKRYKDGIDRHFKEEVTT